MKNFLKILAPIWLCFGMVIVGIVFYGYYTLALRASDDLIGVNIEDSRSSKKSINDKNDYANFDSTDVRSVTGVEFAQAQLKYKDIVKQWGIGSVYIPSAPVKSRILAGMSKNNLMVGVGTYRRGQRLGKGNYVVMSHNLINGRSVLSKLPNTKMNSIVYATDFSTVYEYKVTLNKVVNKKRIDLLNNPKQGKPAEITLFRCQGKRGTSYRALVKGEYVRSYSADIAPRYVKLGLGLLEKEKNNVLNKKNTLKKEDKDSELKSTVKSNEKYNLFQKISINAYMILTKNYFLIGLIYILVIIMLVLIQSIRI